MANGRLEPPACVSEATKAYREESDPLAEFLDDRYELDQAGFVNIRATSPGLPGMVPFKRGEAAR